MRRILLILCSLLASVMLAHGGNIKEVRLHFDASDFTLTQENGAYSISSSKFPTIFDTDTLSPALPYFLVNVLVSPSQEFQSLSVNGQEALLLGGIDLTPNKLPVPTNALNTYAPNQTVSYTKPSYPQESVRYLSMHTLGSYKYVSLMVCPLRYDAGTRSLHLTSDMSISLSLSWNSAISQVDTTTQSDSYKEKKREEIQRLVCNKEDIDRLYPIMASSSTADYFPTQYLIITNEALKPTFQRLANWKTTKGIKSKVLTVEEINRQYNDSIAPMRIKRAIMQYKGQVEYVLLGGDIEVVPSLQCKIGPYSNSKTINTPTDLYYACLSDLDWDKNRNGVFGEIGDNFNNTADLAVSRLSVSTVDDAEMIVGKLIKYEMSPDLQQVSDTILLCGNKLSYASDAQKSCDKLYNQHIAPYWNGVRMRFYNTFTDFEGGANYNVTPLHLQKQLSKGYSLVYMLCHGWPQGWGHLEDGDNGSSSCYDTSHAAALVNPKYTTIVSASCSASYFDMKDGSLCLAESFMRNANSNVLAFVGNSREGFVSRDEDLMAEFYDGVYRYGMSIAEAVSYAKNRYASSYWEFYYKWVMLTLNPLGDPEGHLYLSTPKSFQDVQIQYENNQIRIGLAEDSCNVCLSKIGKDGKLEFFRLQKPQSSVYTFEKIPDEFTVCITKKGFIPYCVKVVKNSEGSLFIQNVSLSENTLFMGKNIIVGKNVKRGAIPGPVRILNGDVTFQAEQGITIKDNFNVKKGASLKIQINH